MADSPRTAHAAIVIPFYNEERRFDRARLVELARHPSLEVIVVDDGSKDRTAELLAELEAGSNGTVHFLKLDRNRGKGEAVRLGLLRALERGRTTIGFTDADFSTRPGELLQLLDTLDARADLDVLIASRVLLVGRKVERKAMRHYLGRVFATIAANILRTPFYDTQCGAKLFRATPMLASALSEPFVSRWAFDVELLGRLLIGTNVVDAVPLERMREVPLEEWVDAGGSKVTPAAMVKTLADLALIEVELTRLRKAVSAAGARRSPGTPTPTGR
jgi:glycosyltransferase involved in cell wall biosynthesis